MKHKNREKENSRPRAQPSTPLAKAWDFIWNSNSIWSWIVNILLAFLLIKFIIYPGLGLILGTNLPIVAVISSSMEHPTGADWVIAPAICNTGPCVQMDWYKEHGITMDEFKKFPFNGGFNKGDIMIIVGKKPSEINIGDVIVFDAGKNYPIIHRVVRIYDLNGETYYETKGDNNPLQLVDYQINEKMVPARSVYGISIIRLPWIGYVKIWATDLPTYLRHFFGGK